MQFNSAVVCHFDCWRPHCRMFSNLDQVSASKTLHSSREICRGSSKESVIARILLIKTSSRLFESIEDDGQPRIPVMDAFAEQSRPCIGGGCVYKPNISCSQCWSRACADNDGVREDWSEHPQPSKQNRSGPFKSGASCLSAKETHLSLVAKAKKKNLQKTLRFWSLSLFWMEKSMPNLPRMGGVANRLGWKRQGAKRGPF